MRKQRATLPTYKRIVRHMEISPDTMCWNWTGCTARNGYGKIMTGSKLDGTKRASLAHRVSYEAFVGPIPPAMEIDHLCRNRRCVNPAHMEPVTHRENGLRGVSMAAQYAKRTHCIRGHEFSGDNLRIGRYGERICIACMRERRRERTLRESQKAAPDLSDQARETAGAVA